MISAVQKRGQLLRGGIRMMSRCQAGGAKGSGERERRGLLLRQDKQAPTTNHPATTTGKSPPTTNQCSEHHLMMQQPVCDLQGVIRQVTMTTKGAARGWTPKHKTVSEPLRKIRKNSGRPKTPPTKVYEKCMRVMSHLSQSPPGW